MRVVDRQPSAERLAAHQPAIDAEIAPDLLECVVVARNTIRLGIAWRRRASMAP